MMRKLAVTVFVLSLSAFGCGSDSGGNKPDTAVGTDGAKTDTIVNDAPIADTPVGPEVQVGKDGPAMDGPTIDVPQGQDVAQGIDTPAVDAQPGVDAQAVDGAKPALDGGHDAQTHVDSGATVDAGSVDGGANG